MKVKPVNEFILVKPMEVKESTTASGIIMVNQNRKPIGRGIVLDVGGTQSTAIVQGVQVNFYEHAKDVVEHDDEECYIIRIKDVLCTITD
ncbi:MAG: hypothetical protein PF569_00030 [Candidatus Woesearchaeota archaeon]|nr:hypothetical protein [Candidatus Woesearchaeota archaeon]